MAVRTRPIVRLDVTNRMVTEGYQKGVYERVTKGIRGGKLCRHGIWKNASWITFLLTVLSESLPVYWRVFGPTGSAT
ncbi:MAG: hypothetical protein DMG77_07500 [Acidobacteria bacterium]|nr:MAG: hypothetical protein DMG77_07500 [Acidobacteriota bacterium]